MVYDHPAGWGGGGFVGLFDTSGTAQPHTFDTDFPSDTWWRVEVFFDCGTQGNSNGGYDYWRHDIGSRIGDGSGNPTNSESGQPILLASARVNHHNIGESFFPDEYAYINNLYIDNTKARVEIGNASRWATCTRREIQIPSAWSSSSIRVTINQGTFGSGNTGYLYVLDANGSVNPTGYPIIIGGGGSDTPPPPPAGLKITN